MLSRTEVFILAHGAQMKNLMFMDRNSNIMEFYPMGWRQWAAGGQFHVPVDGEPRGDAA